MHSFPKTGLQSRPDRSFSSSNMHSKSGSFSLYLEGEKLTMHIITISIMPFRLNAIGTRSIPSPPLPGLTLYEPIANLLNLPSGNGDFEKQVKSCVEDFINAWPQLTVQELAFIYSPLHAPQNVVDVPSLKNLNIFLAVSIFSCIPCARAHKADSAFFGWAAAVRHTTLGGLRLDLQPCEGDFTISVNGHKAALALIGNLGLDPRNTFPHDLDILRRRFLCMNCEDGWDEEKPIFGWRRMVLSSFLSFVRSPAYIRYRSGIIWMSTRSQHPCGSFCLPGQETQNHFVIDDESLVYVASLFS